MEQKENDIRMLNIKISEISRFIQQARAKKKQDKEEQLRQAVSIQEQNKMRQNFNTFKLAKNQGAYTQRRNIRKLQYVDEEVNSNDEESKENNNDIQFFELEATNQKYIKRESKIIDEIARRDNDENTLSPAIVYEKHHPKQSDIIEHSEETEKSVVKEIKKNINPFVNKDIKEIISDSSNSQPKAQTNLKHKSKIPSNTSDSKSKRLSSKRSSSSGSGSSGSSGSSNSNSSSSGSSGSGSSQYSSSSGN